MFFTYKEAEAFFEKRKAIGIKPGLERVHYLLEKLNHPEKEVAAIHVAGTNGKGSTIQFVKEALIASGYKVGIFTSPSFSDVCGHFFIDNQTICRREALSLLNELLPFIEELDREGMHPTEFEILTVMAFVYFKGRTDFVLLETGMGGRFDTTNCQDPVLAIITNVAKDHMQFLGGRLTDIAWHKAGIIKENCPVIVGRVDKESETIIHKEAEEKSSQVFKLFSHFDYAILNEKAFVWSNHSDKKFLFSLQLKGTHQAENASLAFMALHLLEAKGFEIDWQAAIKSISVASLPGRFELVFRHPQIILDSAHNVAGIKAFLKTAEENYPDEEKQLLFAGFKDKQISEMLSEIKNSFDKVTLTTFDHERASSLEDLFSIAAEKQFGIAKDWQTYLEPILKKQDADIVYFVTGSLDFITQVRNWLVKKN